MGRLAGLAVISDPGWYSATGIKEADNTTEIYGFHCFFAVDPSHVFPRPCPTGSTTSQGLWGLKKTLADFLKTVPVGRTLGERLSLGDPSSALGRGRPSEEEIQAWTLRRAHRGALFSNGFLSNNHTNIDLEEWIPHVVWLL